MGETPLWVNLSPNVAGDEFQVFSSSFFPLWKSPGFPFKAVWFWLQTLWRGASSKADFSDMPFEWWFLMGIKRWYIGMIYWFQNGYILVSSNNMIYLGWSDTAGTLFQTNLRVVLCFKVLTMTLTWNPPFLMGRWSPLAGRRQVFHQVDLDDDLR